MSCLVVSIVISMSPYKSTVWTLMTVSISGNPPNDLLENDYSEQQEYYCTRVHFVLPL